MQTGNWSWKVGGKVLVVNSRSEPVLGTGRRAGVQPELQTSTSWNLQPCSERTTHPTSGISNSGILLLC